MKRIAWERVAFILAIALTLGFFVWMIEFHIDCLNRGGETVRGLFGLKCIEVSK